MAIWAIIDLDGRADEQAQRERDREGRQHGRDEQRRKAEGRIAVIHADPHDGDHGDGHGILEDHARHEVRVAGEAEASQQKRQQRHGDGGDRKDGEHGGGTPERLGEGAEVVAERALEGDEGEQGGDQRLQQRELLGEEHREQHEDGRDCRHVATDPIPHAQICLHTAPFPVSRHPLSATQGAILPCILNTYTLV